MREADVPMVNAIAIQSSASSRVGQLVVVLAGIAGAALIVTVGAWLAGQRPAATAKRRGGRLAAPAACLSRIRDSLGARTHPVLAAVVALAAGLVGAVAVSYAAGLVAKLGLVVRLDRPVDHFVDAHRLAAIVGLMRAGTLLGAYSVVYTIAIVGGLIVWVLTRRWLPLLAAVAALLTETAVQRLMHALVHGAKPAQAVAIGPPGGYFSGGSARALIVCGLLAYFVGWVAPARWQRAALWTAAVLAAFVEGYSRLYLGRHWAVDIVGGWLLGALVLASFIFAAQALRPAVQASAGTNWPQADFVAAALPPLTGSEIVR